MPWYRHQYFRRRFCKLTVDERKVQTAVPREYRLSAPCLPAQITIQERSKAVRTDAIEFECNYKRSPVCSTDSIPVTTFGNAYQIHILH